MDIISRIIERAKANKQRIVLPEGTEERTLKAANQILTDEVAELILLGNPEEIMDLAKNGALVTSTKLQSLTLKIIQRWKSMLNFYLSSVKKGNDN